MSEDAPDRIAADARPHSIHGAKWIVPAKEIERSHEERQVLDALRDHPFLSARQLKLYLDWPLRTTRHYLQKLKQRGWVMRRNARQPWLHARSLHALAAPGIAEMAARLHLSPERFAQRAGVDPQRLARLELMMERVFQVRTFLLWLRRTGPGWDWSTHQWDVEVSKLFHARGKAFRLPFHGGAIMSRPDARWNFVVVEWDLRRVPVEKDRERLIQLVIAQDDGRFWGPGHEELFPIWVLIAQDELRLQDYYALLRAAALSRQLPMPRAYLTTLAEVLTLRDYPARPIWYSTVSGRRTPLLHDAAGSSSPLPTEAPWRRLSIDKVPSDENRANRTRPFVGVAAEESASAVSMVEGTSDPFAISRSLGTADKLILDEIANHPLLSPDEIALLLSLQPWRAKQAIGKLVALGLAEEHSIRAPDAAPLQSLAKASGMAKDSHRANENRYVLAYNAVPYLAMIAGFERAVRRFIRARGWLDGFSTLVRYGEHTREENAFFLGLAAIARERHDELVWLSELESRLYYDDGHEYVARIGRHRTRSESHAGSGPVVRRRFTRPWRRSFLPDGRGSYLAGGQRYDFALEIDRSHQAKSKMRRKLLEYYACLTSNILRGKGIELLRLWIVTTGWKRAETLRTLAEELEEEVEVRGLLPIFITTFDDVRQGAANEPIWLRVGPLPPNESALTAQKTYCLDCFVPKPRAPHKRRRVPITERMKEKEVSNDPRPASRSSDSH